MTGTSEDGDSLPKRPFERKDGVLYDEWTAPDGSKASLRLPASLLGEAPADDERADLLARASSDSMAAYALSGDESEELLKALLDGLDSDAAQPGRLVRWADDPRVRPALLDAFRKQRPGTLANFAKVVGRLGGEGAAELLREKLDDLLTRSYADEESHADEVYTSDVRAAFNLYAFDLVVVAHALLRLDPNATDAARALVRLAEHPCGRNRLDALRYASEIIAVSRTVQTEAIRLLRRSLEPLLDADEPEVFLRVAPGFIDSAHDDGLIGRAASLLRHDESDVRHQAVSLLQAVPARYAAQVQRALGMASADEFDLRERVGLAARLGGLVPDKERVELARRALAEPSPSLRWNALLLLEELAADDARQAAKDAIVDEPDAALRSRLEAFCEKISESEEM